MTSSNSDGSVVIADSSSIIEAVGGGAAGSGAGGGSETSATSIVYPNVRMTVKLCSASDIEVSSNSFEAVLEIYYSWQNEMEQPSPDGNGLWYPQISFDNATKQENVVDRIHEKSGAHWTRDTRIHATFKASFHLRHFPFDTQRLEFVWRPIDHFRFDSVTATLDDHMKLVEYDVETSPEVFRNADWTVVGMTIHVRRKFSFYLWNVVFPLFLFGTIALVSFYLSMGDLEKRTGLCISLLLVVMVMMLAHANNTKVPFLTVLHSYYLSCLLWIFAIGACNLAVTERFAKETSEFTAAAAAAAAVAELVDASPSAAATIAHSSGGPSASELNSLFHLIFSIVWLAFHALMVVYFWAWHYIGLPSPYELITKTRTRRTFRSGPKNATQRVSAADELAMVKRSQLLATDDESAAPLGGCLSASSSQVPENLFALSTPMIGKGQDFSSEATRGGGRGRMRRSIRPLVLDSIRVECADKGAGASIGADKDNV